VYSVKEQLFNYIVLCFIKLQILASRISSFPLLRSQHNFCSGLRTWKFWQILLILLNISVLITGHVEHDIRILLWTIVFFKFPLGTCTLIKYVDIVNAELTESTPKQTIMCSYFNDFLWLSKYKKCCVHPIFSDCFIWLMFILKKI
jgi:hypothetical protein